MVVIIAGGCRGGSDGKDRDLQNDQTWHMTDEIVQAGLSGEDDFMMAAHDGDLVTVKALHKLGMDCNTANQEGQTALMYAAFNGHSEIVVYLLDAGAEPGLTDFMGRTALLYGSTGPFPETVRILLDRGADPNRVDSEEHFSPLMHAAAEGHLEVVRVLVEHGADIFLKDLDGDDAAAFAAQAGHMHIVEYLNSQGD